MTFQTINPANEEVLETYEELNASEINKKLEKAHLAFADWRKTSFEKRSSLMKNAANILRVNKEKYARLMSLEMGKPISQAIGEVEKCAWVCEYYAENAENQLKNIEVNTEYKRSYSHFSPIGAGTCDYALEFPILAGISLCGSRLNGWERRNTKACAQYDGMRNRD